MSATNEISAIVVLEHVKTVRPLLGNIPLGENVFITGNKDALKEILLRCGQSVLGEAIYENLSTAANSEYNHIFAIFVQNDIQSGGQEQTFDDILPTLFAHVMPYSIALWLQKDFSLVLRTCIAVLTLEDERHVKVIPFGMSSYNCTGKISETEFTESELVEARNNYIAATVNTHATVGDHQLASIHTLRVLSRQQRIWHILLAARSEYILAYRILFYMTAMEALLMRDNQELSHRLSERCATLLSTNNSERVQIFNRVKEAYKHRSLFVHGMTSSLSDEDMIALSRDCDSYLRNLMFMENEVLRYPEIFNIDDHKIFNDFFLGRLFPTS
jgi:hypothetical protein